nr:unnamed protein product [Callosobruchus analis]
MIATNRKCIKEHCDLNEEIIPEPSSDIYEKGDTPLDSDIKRRLLEDIKFYEKRVKKRHTLKENVAATDERKGLEKRLKDRLKVIFSRRCDWLKKTVNALNRKTPNINITRNIRLSVFAKVRI